MPNTVKNVARTHSGLALLVRCVALRVATVLATCHMTFLWLSGGTFELYGSVTSGCDTWLPREWLRVRSRKCSNVLGSEGISSARPAPDRRLLSFAFLLWRVCMGLFVFRWLGGVGGCLCFLCASSRAFHRSWPVCRKFDDLQLIFWPSPVPPIALSHLYKAWLRTPSDCSEQACSEHSACTLFNKRQEHMKGIHRHLGSSHGGSRLTPFLARNTIVIWLCG